MDKYEYQAKLEEINKLIERKNYEEAVSIADTIEWKRVRSVRTLCAISEVYEAVGRAEDGKAILYRAYRRSPNSRQILYRLTEACIQTQDFDDAVEYYTEYVNLSPNDNSKYILKYEIYKGRGSSVEEQIAVLEELKNKEYTEQWAYELAKLYDQAGMVDKCVAECDDLTLWFHNGKYVVQALELKKKYRPLTREQQTVYDNPSEIVDMETKEAVVEKAVPTLDEEITKELPQSEKDVVADSIIMDTDKEIAAAVQAMAGQDSTGDTKEETEKKEKPRNTPERSLNTVELQTELANSMKEILSGIRSAAPTVELESLPVMSQIKAVESAAEEEQIPGQMNIDDLLLGGVSAEEPAEDAGSKEKSGAAEAKPASADSTKEAAADVLTAPTINISGKIAQETGGKPIREYAAGLQSRAEHLKEAAKTATAGISHTLESAAEDAKAAVEAAMQHAQGAHGRNEMPQPAVKKAEPAAALQEEAAPTAAEMPAADIKDSEKAPEKAPEEKKDAGIPEQKLEEATPEEVAAHAQRLAAQRAAREYTHDALDEKEQALLGFWGQIRGMEGQVNAAVTEVMRSSLSGKTSSRGNVLLVGDAGNGRTTLAISLAKIISRCKGQSVARVAKIYAEDFNNKDIAATVNKMAGGVLIIEEAGDLNENAVNQLAMAMEFKTDSLVVVLEDEKRYLQDLLARNPQFAQKFTATIQVPMLTNDELVEFGRYYANQNGCVLDESAISTLYDGIGVMQSPEQPVAILDVKEIVDKAMKSAHRFGPGKMISSISGKRYDENDRVILKAKNFKKIK